LQDARARGESIPRHCLDTRLLMYREVARFGKQVERLFGAAGRERTHVIVFDDLFLTDSLGTYRKVLEFLRVDDDGRTWFKRKNESRIYRFRWLQELFVRSAPGAGSGKRIEQRVARKVELREAKRNSWIKSLAQWNIVAAEPAPLTPEMRALVADTLRPDIELLSRLLKRDMGFWLDGLAQAPETA
jgi:hypothetical protein